MKKVVQIVSVICVIYAGFPDGLKAEESVSILASKDNTIYDNAANKSNGSGNYLFTGTSNNNGSKRALLYFDFKGSIPENSVVDSVVLSLKMDKGQLTTPEPVSVHRLTNSWGEGGSIGINGEGQGNLAEAGEATWSHRYYDTLSWESPGGDYIITASSTADVGGVAIIEWRGSGLAADVNLWLSDESKNHGWIIKGGEGRAQSAKRYVSRNASETLFRPTMTLYYHEQLVSSGPPVDREIQKLNAYPNPFIDELSIYLTLDRDETIQLGIYNLLGKQIKQVINGVHSTGNYQFTWDGRDRSGKSVPAGMYYIIFVKGEEKQVIKILKSR